MWTKRRKNMTLLEAKAVENEYMNSQELQLKFSDLKSYMALAHAVFSGKCSRRDVEDTLEKAPVFSELLNTVEAEYNKQCKK